LNYRRRARRRGVDIDEEGTTVKTAIGWIAAIALVASTIQARAENVLLKCTPNEPKGEAFYLDIDEHRVIYNGHFVDTVDKSSIAISQFYISFEEIASHIRAAWRIDRTTREYSLVQTLTGRPPGKPIIGTCEKDTRPSPKI
jgi:hypothetical protein